jgi:chemotaxis protein histidine kinase CheA
VDGLRDADRKEFEALVRAYRQELGPKLKSMQASAAALVRHGWDRPTVESLYHQAHRIVGSSGVYGLASLTRASGILEDLLRGLLHHSTWPPADSPRALLTVLKAVTQAAREPHPPHA